MYPLTLLYDVLVAVSGLQVQFQRRCDVVGNGVGFRIGGHRTISLYGVLNLRVLYCLLLQTVRSVYPGVQPPVADDLMPLQPLLTVDLLMQMTTDMKVH
jgi:hypothetical protein